MHEASQFDAQLTSPIAMGEGDSIVAALVKVLEPNG